MSKGKLIFFCGKMGAGKSTKAGEVASERSAVLLSEDEWLAALYPNKILTLDDYLKYSKRLKPQIKRLAQSILLAGTDVVMDFPANTLAQRDWFKTIFEEVEATHLLLYINVTNETCLKQINQRREEQPDRAATDTAEMFEQVTPHFVEPTAEEGFNIKIV